MDPELIIYLIFLAIIFLSRLLKKPAQKSSGPPPDQEPRRPQRPVKSFEDLLEEFTGQTSEREETIEEEYSEPVPEEAPSNEDPEELRRYYEVPDYTTNYESYGGELKTLDEMVDINEVRTTTRLASADEEEVEQAGTEWQDMLRDPGDARRAIILSEIIRRRY